MRDGSNKTDGMQQHTIQLASQTRQKTKVEE